MLGGGAPHLVVKISRDSLYLGYTEAAENQGVLLKGLYTDSLILRPSSGLQRRKGSLEGISDIQKETEFCNFKWVGETLAIDPVLNTPPG